MDLHGLPSKPDELRPLLQQGLSSAMSVRNFEAVIWEVTRYWLRGLREFDYVDPTTGVVEATWCDPTDSVIFEQALGSVQEEIGRLLRVDLKPSVESLGIGLDATRKSAISHAALTALAAQMGYDNAVRTFVTLLVHYGTVGVLLDETIRKDKEWRPRFEIVPPWELLGMPSDAPGPLHTRALVRQRWVPWPWLESLAKDGSDLVRPRLSLPTGDAFNQLEIRRIPYGGIISITGEPTGSHGNPFSMAGLNAQQRSVDFDRKEDPRKTNSNGVPHVRMDEIWFSSDQENIDRYVVFLGNQHVATDMNFWKDGIQRPMPMGVSRYLEVGGFYGRGFAFPKIEMNQITERLLEQQLRNIEDFDQYGKILAPRTAGLRRHDLLRPRDGGPAFGTFEVDPLAPSQAPFALQPVTTGNMTSQIIALMDSLENKVLPQYSIFSPDAPQRADGNPALQTIDQAANEPRSAPTRAMASCWITVYRSLLEAARRQYKKAGVIPLVMLDEAMVGIVLKDGSLSLDTNALPKHDEVKVSVRSRSPRNEALIASWLGEALEKKLVTPRQFRIELRKNGVEGMPVANEGEWNAYQKVILNIITVFNDGTTPGEYVLSPEGDMLDIHYEYVKNFMAGPRYAMSSEAVRQKFVDYVQDLEGIMGKPTGGLPYLEDQAMMDKVMMDQMGAGGPQFPMAPPTM